MDATELFLRSLELAAKLRPEENSWTDLFENARIIADEAKAYAAADEN